VKIGEVTGECSLCCAAIVYGEHGQLNQRTGWVWRRSPRGQLQPVCARCKAEHDGGRLGSAFNSE
jgi:hypothetical protein